MASSEPKLEKLNWRYVLTKSLQPFDFTTVYWSTCEESKTLSLYLAVCKSTPDQSSTLSKSHVEILTLKGVCIMCVYCISYTFSDQR